MFLLAFEPSDPASCGDMEWKNVIAAFLIGLGAAGCSEQEPAVPPPSPTPTPAVSSTPPPLRDWRVPRTLTTRTGRVYRNVTIHSISRDGGVVIYYGANAIKLPSGTLSEEDVTEIIATQPKSTPTPQRPVEMPPFSPPSGLRRIGG